MNRLALSTALVVIGFLMAACDDDDPMPGDLQVMSGTSGSSLDPDGYAFVLNGLEQYPLGINDTVLIQELPPGPYTIELGGLALNCETTGDNPVTVGVSGGVTRVFWDVLCQPAGSLRLTANTTGNSIDANGYGVAIDGEIVLAIRANEIVVIPGLLAGPHDVELVSVASNCTVAGDNPRNVNVAADEISVTTFEVTCEAALIDHIAFTREQAGNQDIYIVDRTGTELTNLTNDPAADFAAAVSPDGTQIAFTTDRDGDNEIYVMSFDGTELVNMTNDAASDERPAWSPDGQRIAFVSDRNDNLDIYVMDRDGSNVTRLTFNGNPDSWPTWSPDGERIAFSSQRDRNWEVYVMDADGANMINLTNNPAADRAPDWGSGDIIVFSTDRDGNSEIYAMTPTGEDLTNLTNNLAIDLAPAWSPDGTKVAFSTDRGGDLDIYFLNYYTPGLVKLTDSGGTDYDPSWSPMQ